jgi:DNA-binding XRE family transcriptional regulator
MTDPAFYQEMGRRIKAIRRARRLTQVQLGARLGVNKYALGDMEKVGRRYLTDERLTQIATALGVFVWQIAAEDWREQCGVEPAPAPKPIAPPRAFAPHFCTMCQERRVTLHTYDGYDICPSCLLEAARLRRTQCGVGE